MPPIWFGFDFVTWKPSPEKLEYMKHGQDVARNIWIAFVVLLSAMTGVKLKVDQ